MDRERLTILLGLIIILILLGYRVFLVNNLTVENVVLGELQKKINDTRQQNILIEEQILKESALNTIQSKATEQGFIYYEKPYIIRP